MHFHNNIQNIDDYSYKYVSFIKWEMGPFWKKNKNFENPINDMVSSSIWKITLYRLSNINKAEKGERGSSV